MRFRKAIYVAILALICAPLAGATAHAIEPFYDPSYEPALVAGVDAGTYGGIAVSPVGDINGAPSWYRADLLLGGCASGRLCSATGTSMSIPKAVQAGSNAPAVGSSLSSNQLDVGLKIARTIDTLWLRLEGVSPFVISNPSGLSYTGWGWCVEGQGFPNAAPCDSGVGNLSKNASGTGLDPISGHDLVLNPYWSSAVTDCHSSTEHSVSGIIFATSNMIGNPAHGGTISSCMNSLISRWHNTYSDVHSWMIANCSGGAPDFSKTGYATCYYEDLGSYAGGGTCAAVINALLNTYGDSTAYENPSGTTDECYAVILPEKGYLENFVQGPLQKFTTQTAGVVTTDTITAPSVYTSANQAQQIRCQMDSTCTAPPSSNTVDSPYPSPATSDEFDCIVSPADYDCPSGQADHITGGHIKSGSITITGTVPITVSGTIPVTATSFPMQMPVPDAGETPAQYTDKLHSLGWAGTANVIGDTAYETGLLLAGTCASANCDYANQPDNTINGVTSPAGGTVSHTFDSNGQYNPPLVMPTISTASSSVDIYVKPDPSQFEQTSSTAQYGKIDWSPITSISYGSHFPFGVIAWVQNTFDTVDTNLGPRDSCPSIPFPYESGTGAGTTTFTVPFCSTATVNTLPGGANFITTYRVWIYPLLEALMTLAAVVWLGMQVIGMGKGDSGE